MGELSIRRSARVHARAGSCARGGAIVAVSPLRCRRTHTRSRVVPLVSDQPGVAPHTDPEPRQRLGPDGSSPTTPVVGVRQRHRQVDALSRLRRYAVPVGQLARCERARRDRRVPSSTRRPASSCRPGERRCSSSTPRTGMVPRLERGAGHNRGRRSSDRSDDGAIYKGLAIADTVGRPAPLRGRLPQRQGRRVRRELRPGAGQRLRRSGAAERLRALRRPGDRRPRVRHVREAGR